jgi:hypothetical protein
MVLWCPVLGAGSLSNLHAMSMESLGLNPIDEYYSDAV